MKIEFLDIAEAELDDAFEYYDEIYKGLGTRFIEEIESALTRFKAPPWLGKSLVITPIDACSTVFLIQSYTRSEMT